MKGESISSSRIKLTSMEKYYEPKNSFQPGKPKLTE